MKGIDHPRAKVIDGDGSQMQQRRRSRGKTLGGSPERQLSPRATLAAGCPAIEVVGHYRNSGALVYEAIQPV
jgi:hypothetical protein